MPAYTIPAIPGIGSIHLLTTSVIAKPTTARHTTKHAVTTLADDISVLDGIIMRILFSFFFVPIYCSQLVCDKTMKRTRSSDDLNGPEHTPRIAASTAELADRLWIAAEKQDVISIVALTRAGADPNAVRDGGSILTAALRFDDHTHDAVSALLDAGAGPNLEIPKNARGDSWGSVLSCAVYCGCHSIVRLLLARGAQPHMDALRTACNWQNVEGAEALLCAGCRIDVATEPTISDLLDHVFFGLPFHGTTREHRVREFATLFVRAGARIDTQTRHRFPGLDEVVTDTHNERRIAKRAAKTFIVGCAVPVDDSPVALLAGFPEIAGFIAFHSLDPVCTARVNRRPELP